MVRWLIAISLLSTTAFAKDKLVATPLNSPVKETFLKVKLEGFDSISGVLFKPKNGGSEIPGEVIKEGNSYIGKFKASFLKPGNYEYRVKIKSSSGNSQKDESASVAFITFAVDSSLEVADPGEEGKKTLAGIDSDNNGVRDDIQRWINEEFQNKPSTKRALIQGAINDQKMLVNSSNRELLRSEVALETGKYITCLAWINKNFIQISSEADSRFVNTEARVKSRLSAEQHFQGLSRPEEITNTPYNQRNKFCNFPATKE